MDGWMDCLMGVSAMLEGHVSGLDVLLCVFFVALWEEQGEHGCHGGVEHWGQVDAGTTPALTHDTHRAYDCFKRHIGDG
jgi:hypothetical protein